MATPVSDDFHFPIDVKLAAMALRVVWSQFGSYNLKQAQTGDRFAGGIEKKE